ncbi:MAG: 3-dehydroquinate synthase, partial [Bacteroidaceae bacterium]|nr:3-dehydroquinate synthase [Bacteroidaceae bacterium]
PWRPMMPGHCAHCCVTDASQKNFQKSNMETPTRITVNASGKYDILLRKGGLSGIGQAVAEISKPCKIAVLSDDKVFPLYGKSVIESLEKAGFSTVCHIIPNGEQSKTLDNVTAFIDSMVKAQVTRTDMVLALGGGVVGDMAGFAAAIYLRGIPYIQVPTTLLAAVDSSVGGKTAVDISAGKNLVGAFHQPALVYLDTETLNTLDPAVMRDGFAEVLKYGFILDRELAHTTARPGTFDLEQVIARCISIKRDVVEKDEFDKGLRGLLNFGHTFGHAIEKLSGFTITHGSAVARGMIIAAKVAKVYGFTDYTDVITKIVKDYGFETECPFSADELYGVILSDKKRSGADITLVLPKEIGACTLEKMPAAQVLELMKKAGL